MAKTEDFDPQAARREHLSTELSELRGSPPGVKTGPAGRIRTRLQEVLVKDADEWRIASYHNVDVKED